MEEKESVFEVFILDSDDEADASKEKQNEILRGLLPQGEENPFEENSVPETIKRCLVEHDYFKIKFDTQRSTLPFENENSDEQQTIDFECLGPQVNPKDLIDLYEKTVTDKKRNKSVSSSSSSSNGGGDRKEDLESRLKGCYNSTESDDSDSVDSCESAKEAWKNIFGRNVKKQDDDFVSIRDLASKIRAMQKVAKLKCVDSRKSVGISPPKYKTILKGDNFPGMPEYFFPLPNLTKMVNGENWNVEYVDNEIQSLGLDDLLLKASELNAENFTKALGRKSDSSKTNVRKDSPEIVFAIPKSKRGIEENESEDAAAKGSKTFQVDISKPFFDKGKGSEFQPESPKRSCIKVKTVENINEEFEGSLGRLNGFDKNLDKAEKSEEQKAGESEPVVMTIIQSKADKKAPAILRNSYLKRRASSEKVKAAEKKNEDEEGEKKEEGDAKTEESNAAQNESDQGQDDDKCKLRTVPVILNHSQKLQQTSNGKSKLVKINEGKEKSLEKIFKITSTEQKLGPKETNQRFIKVVPYEPLNKSAAAAKSPQSHQKTSDDESDCEKNCLSFTALSTILKDVLPEEWVLSLDKKIGLQVIKTHLDDLLNPSILISLVIARTGKLVVNICGRQLKQSHELFLNNGEMRNAENKLSLSYVLAILDKLRRRTVCLGCDDPSLKKYWCEEGSIEYQTEFQQIYRSRFCGLLISPGRKRCYPCYRLNESLKKKLRKDKSGEKKDDAKEPLPDSKPKRGVKRNLEDFLEESFSTMKQQIVDEIEKNKKLGERENALKAQEEVLSFMGLARKESLDNAVRKSKRKKNSFYKLEPPVKKKIDQQELEFLEKYWTDINTLFSTSLLFGAYSRTGTNRLREKCRMFQKLLSTWKNIMSSNPEWIGGEVNLPEEPSDNDNLQEKDSPEQFEKMDVPALRAYIINSVKEVNKIKHKLRTRNSYFKVLYNKFVKRRMKKPKIIGANSNGTRSSETSTTNTPTPTDFSSDENSREKLGEESSRAANEPASTGDDGE